MIEHKVWKKGNLIVKALCDKYQKHFSHINPEWVIVLNTYGVGKRKYLARIRNIPPELKLLFGEKYENVLYVMELNKDCMYDKVGGDMKRYKLLRNIVMFHELFHIHPLKIGNMRTHTVMDFVEVLKKVGLATWTNDKKLPDILRKGTESDPV